MGASRFLLALVAAASIAPGASAGGPDLEVRRALRRQEAEAAAREIRATHFFEEGRGIHALPGLHGFLRAGGTFAPRATHSTLRDRMGLVHDEEGWVGLHEGSCEGRSVPVFGCAACHAGRAAGRTYVGLGNKNVDVAAIGSVELDFAIFYRLAEPALDAVERRVTAQALSTARLLVDRRWTNSTQGLVPVALIWTWFYRSQGLEVPALARSAVKVPHLWGYGAKRQAGLFCDGLGDGTRSGWVTMVEATAGQRPGTIRAYQPRAQQVETLFARLLPPRYPSAVDAEQAGRGGLVFARECARCHGEYRRDRDGFPVFEPPLHVPLAVVGTDGDRLRSVTPEFRRLIEASPLRDLVRLTDHRDGYLAPRLDGIWARFPYLHNGSVPTLHALLTPPEARPRVWSLQRAGEAWRFDPLRVGLTLPPPGSDTERRLLERGHRGARDVYLTERPGHSSRGHPFGTDLPADEKRALLEHLKGL